ncbi:DUF6893 family small protein [Streptomyces phaeoluteigriseus]|nr:hypothetical protein [Streptomyces phaeoluteigriseus]
MRRHDMRRHEMRRNGMKRIVIGGGAAAAMVALVVEVLPDVRRYLRIRRM